MSLIDCMMTPCVFMLQHRVPDGSGGFNTAWSEGEPFGAVITLDTSEDARIADVAKEVQKYTISVSRAVHLKYHDVFKRLSDGKTFRITSDNADKQTPLCTALDIAQSSAEAWRLTE